MNVASHLNQVAPYVSMTRNTKAKKFGGSRSRLNHKVNEGNVQEAPDPFKQRIHEERPRAPQRPPQTPFNGRRGQNVSKSEYQQLSRLNRSVLMNAAELGALTLWYRMRYSEILRAELEVWRNSAFGRSRKNFPGCIPDDDLAYDMRVAMRDHFFDTNFSGAVTRQVVARSRKGLKEGAVQQPEVHSQLNGANGETTGSDDVERMSHGIFPVPFVNSFSTGVSMEEVFSEMRVLSVAGVRYLLTKYATAKDYCVGFLAHPLECCEVCRHGASMNSAALEESISRLDDPFYHHIPCPCDCNAIVAETPECVLPRGGYYDLIRRAMDNRSHSLNHATSQLNGSHGEYTESDDVKKTGQQAGLLAKLANIERRLASVMLNSTRKGRQRKSGKAKTGGRGGGRRAGSGGGGARPMRGNIDRNKTGGTVSNFGALAKLHPHTQKYMIALANPHSESAIGVGDVIRAHNSRKADGRTTFVVAPTATECIMLFICPAVANDDACIMEVKCTDTDTGTYNGTTAGAGTRKRIAIPDLPYANAQIGPEGAGVDGAVSGKVVCLGLKLTAIGAALNRGGEAFWYESDNHSSIIPTGSTNFATAYASVTGKRTCRRVDLARDQAHEFTVTPHVSAEHEFPIGSNKNLFPHSYRYPYSQQGFAFSTLGSIDDGAPVACLIIPAQANVSYRVEVKIHCEYIGGTAKQSATMTHSDPEIGRTIADSVIKVKQTQHLTPHNSCVGDVFKTVMTELGSKALQGGVNMLKKEMANPELLSSAASAVGALLM